MGIKINCVDNEQGAWCKNKNIKRCLFGFGARTCILFPFKGDNICKYQEEYPRPDAPPPPPKARYIK